MKEAPLAFMTASLQSLTLDRNNGIGSIEPFFCYYPERSDLNRKQSACYKRIREALDNGDFVDVGESKTYLFLYINDALRKVKKKKDIERVIKILELLRKLYNDDVMLLSYVEEWLQAT